jgi:uncharacterized protein (DUF1778 family)
MVLPNTLKAQEAIPPKQTITTVVVDRIETTEELTQVKASIVPAVREVAIPAATITVKSRVDFTMEAAVQDNNRTAAATIIIISQNLNTITISERE